MFSFAHVKKSLLSTVIILSSSTLSALEFGVDTVDLEFTISGSTSMDAQIIEHIYQLCDPASTDTYVNNAENASAYFCVVPAANSGLGSAKNILFRFGGSSSGAAAELVSNNQSVPQLNLTGCTETASGSTRWVCSDTLVSVNPGIGISNVEPELYKNVENGSYSFSATNVNIEVINAQTFGFVVSPGLYEALQYAQGVSAIGSSEVENMPSLSASLISAFYAGQIGDWNNLKGANGQGLVDLYNSVVNPGGNIDSTVRLCQRSGGSGTKAMMAALVMGNPCNYRGAGDVGFLGKYIANDSDQVADSYDPIPDGFFGPLPGPHVYDATSSSEIGKCMTTLSGHDFFALGYQSLDKVDEGRTDRNQFKFIAINGIAPTLENIVAGSYPLWTASTVFWRSDVVTGDKLTLANNFVDNLKDVAAVAAANSALLVDDSTNPYDDRPAGSFNTPEILEGGVPANVGSLVFANQNGGIEPSVPFDANNPVSPYNRGLSYGTSSSCRVPVLGSTNKLDVSR